MTRTCRLDLIDAARPGLFDRIRRFGRLAGRVVIVALAVLAAWQTRELFRELDALRAAKSAWKEQQPATPQTAAGPGKGNLRQVWMRMPGTISPGTEFAVWLVYDEVRPMVAGR